MGFKAILEVLFDGHLVMEIFNEVELDDASHSFE